MPTPTQPPEAPQVGADAPLSEQPPSQPVSWRRPFGPSTAWLLFVVASPILLHLFGLIHIPFWPFTTKGSIYVDSPEVYTRERLVNDRYDQDYWLREQLRLLDNVEKGNLITQEVVTLLKASLGDATGEAEPQTGSESATDTSGRNLTFEQRFRVVSGVRDMIRQLILENMLDDRHDLTGNSVYGLKFDTTIVPGDNTRQRAFVSVTLEPDTLFANPETTQSSEGPEQGEALIPQHVRAFVANGVLLEGDEAGETEPSPGPEQAGQSATRVNYLRQSEYYDSWLTDIAKRLNRMEDSLFESMEGCPTAERRGDEIWHEGMTFYDELTRRTLAVVLGLPEERFTIYNRRDDPRKTAVTDATTGDGRQVDTPVIRLPDPWARYIRIYRERISLPGDRACDYRVWFEVLPVTEAFVARSTSGGGEDAESAGPGFCPLTEAGEIDCRSLDLVSVFPDNGDWNLLVPCRTLCEREQRFVNPNPKYLPAPAVLDEIAKRAQQAPSGQEPGVYLRVGVPLRPRDLEVWVESGLLNFIESMGKLDAYSYAIFPKNDVVGVLSDSATRLSGNAVQGGILDVARRLVESKTLSVLVGYGDGGRSREDDRSVRFGWIISSPDEMQPSLKTQLALVSVPAWMAELKLKLTTGWVDNDGRQIAAGWIDSEGRQFDADQPKTMIVNVPPDFAAFDSIFRDDAWVTRGPRIQDDAMDKEAYVVAGKDTQILITGTRLWRSATVTLGAQAADRIRVLPNMEGLIAEFQPVKLPYAVYNPASNRKRRPSSKKDEPELKCPLEVPELEAMRARPVRLRVWTSEGVATALAPVCVIYDPVAIKQPPKG